MGDSFFEYGGVAPERFSLWEDVLQDIGPARDSRSDRQVLQAFEQLWPHLEALNRLVDPSRSHVAVHLESIRRSMASARADQKRRRVGDASLDLHHAVESIERLLLGLIGPQGQSPVPQRGVEIPLSPLFEAWLVLSTGCVNLVPGPAATQVIRWTETRAFLRPAQVKTLAASEFRAVSLEECHAQIRAWNKISAVEREVGNETYAPLNARFLEVLSGLRNDLQAYASRGEGYIGWTAWYGYE